MKRNSLVYRLFLISAILPASFALLAQGLPKQENAALPNTNGYFIPDFKDGFVAKDNALALSERCYMITENKGNQHGRLWWSTKIDLSKPFRLDFIIFAGDKDGGGADGFGFVLQDDPRGTEAQGSYGGGLGFGKLLSTQKYISPSVGIEFDTWQNLDCNATNSAGSDPLDDHTAIVYNGDLCNPKKSDLGNGKTPIIHPTFKNIEDNACYDYVILWFPNSDGTQTIQMYVEDQLRISHTGNMIKDVFGGKTNVLYGFTGSTGGANNEQTICLSGGQQPPLTEPDSYTTPQNTSVNMPVRANDIKLNPNLNTLWTFTLVTPPNNGTSYIDGETLDVVYTPNVGFTGKDSLQYEICDVPIGRCYSLCSQEWAAINVTCVDFTFALEKLTDNELCNTSLPNNGSARAFITQGINNNEGLVIWKESFNDVKNGSTKDEGATKWTSSNTTLLGYAKVVSQNSNKLFEVNNTTATWTSESIPTKESVSKEKYKNVKIRINLKEIGNHESTDQVKVYYQIGSQSKKEFFQKAGDFSAGSTSASVAIPNADIGDNIKIIIEFANNAIDEYYSVDEIIVSGDAPPSAASVSAGYNFYWYNGPAGQTNPADLVYSGSVYNTMPAGTYTVNAISDYGCKAKAPLTVRIDKKSDAPKVVIIQNKPLTNCKRPNGELEAYVDINGVKTTVGYKFLWYVGVDFTSSFATGPVATGLKAQNYSVRVTNNTSGCESVNDETVTSSLTAPKVTNVTPTHVTSCKDPDSGSATVTSDTKNATFEWFRGKSIGRVISHTGASVTGLSPGFYTVQAVNTDGCVSQPNTIEILNKSKAPPIETTFTNNTSCRTDGNGTIKALSGGTSSGFTFEFFTGLNTSIENKLPNHQISGDNKNIATLLKKGNYTVKVTSSEGCVNKAVVSISDLDIELSLDRQAIGLTGNSGCNGVNTGILNASKAVDYNQAAYDASGRPIAITSSSNGSFEVPDLDGSTPIYQTFDTNRKAYDEKYVTGWETTDSKNAIEIWDSESGVPAYEGDQFAEINAYDNATLYFDVATVPGVVMDWEFAHRGRAGKDCIALLINAPNATKEIKIDQFCTGKDAWALYKGTYTVPAGQYITRYYYRAVSTASTSISVGNFLDAITFQAAKSQFSIYQGSDTNGTPLSTNDTGVFNSLASGSYSLKYTDNLTGCSISELNLEITSDTTEPTTTVTSTDNTLCINGDGKITVVAGSVNPENEPVNGYTMELVQNGKVVQTTTKVTWKNATERATYIFKDLVSSTYTVKVFDPARNCVFNKDIFVDDISEKPVFLQAQHTNEPNTGCTVKDGRLGVEIEDPSTHNAVDPAGYTFEWFYAGTPGAPLAAPVKMVSGTNPGNGSLPVIKANTVSGLATGDYAVKATRTATGCVSDLLPLHVAENLAIPDVVISKLADDVSCNTSGTGKLVAKVIARITTVAGKADTTFSNTGFNFTWFTGQDAKGSGIAGIGVEKNEFHNLKDGMQYSVKVTSTSNGCEKVSNFSLSDKPSVFPVITLKNKDDNKSCNLDTYNGFISINAEFNGKSLDDPANSSYQFRIEWFNNGTGTGSALTNVAPITGATTITIQGLSMGTYSAKVTNLTTGCESGVFSTSIGEKKPEVVPVESSNGRNEVCDPNKVGPGRPKATGTVTFTPTTGGVSSGNYSFALKAGSTTIAGTGGTGKYADVRYSASGGSTTITGLPDGTYKVLIKDEVSKCDKEHTFTIALPNQSPTVPAPDTNIAKTSNSKCVSTAGFTGTATVDFTDIQGGKGTSINDYSFLWAKASAPTAAVDTDNVLGTDATLTPPVGVEDGNYVLTITDRITGCVSNPIPVTIDSQKPTLAVAESGKDPNSVCDPSKNDTGKKDANGKITLTPSGGTGTLYSFVLKNQTGIEIKSDKSTSGYKDVTFSPSSVPATTIEGLPEGNYKVTITDDASGCTLESNFVIALTTTNPSIATPATDIAKTSNSKCTSTAGFTGTATVDFADIKNGKGALLTDYSFSWAKASAPTLAVDTDNVLGTNAASTPPVGVENGDYVLTITDRITGCVSKPILVTIDSQKPTLAVKESGKDPNSVCDPSKNDTGKKDANGKITLTPSGGTGTLYSFVLKNQTGIEIKSDKSTSGYKDVTFSPSSVPATTIEGLPEGNYKVTITDDASGCTLESNFDIALTTTNPSIATPATDIAKTSNSKCTSTAGFTGTATVDFADIKDGKGTLLTDYSFSWAKASAPTLAVDTDNVLGTNAASTPPVGVENGDYVLTITDRITGCVSKPILVTIDSQKPTLAVKESGKDPNSVCDPSKNDTGKKDANGKITLTPSGGTGTLYSFVLKNQTGIEIKSDKSTSGYKDVTFSPSSVPATTIEGLPEGNYKVTITDDASGCTLESNFDIALTTTNPSIATPATDIAKTSNSKCTSTAGFTGTATVDFADIKNGKGALLTDYSFSWAKASAPTLAVDTDNVLGTNAASTPPVGVENGDYVLTITDRITGCVSDPISVTIDSQKPTLAVAESGKDPNSVCDPSKNDTGKKDANGKITLTPSGSTGTLYSFVLKNQTGIEIKSDKSTSGYKDVTFSPSSVPATTIEGLPEGNYKVTITDDASGCTLESNFVIALTTTNPSIANPATDIAKTSNSKCVSTAGFTGTATVDFADIKNGKGALLTDYSFSWAKASAPTLAVDTDNVLGTNAPSTPLVGVEDGDYVLTITDQITGCVSNPIPVTIDSQKPTLTVAESGEEPNSVCDPSKNDTGKRDANGKITLTPSGSTGTSYSFVLKNQTGIEIKSDKSTSGYKDVTFSPSSVPATTIEGLPEGNYKVTITDDASGCTLEKNFDIALTTTNPSIDPVTKITKTANSNCVSTAGFTGTATVELSDIQGGNPAADYSFFWAKASAPTLAVDTDNVLGTNAPSTPLVGVEDGDYVLTITDRITGCVSNPIPVTIDSQKPTLTVAESGEEPNSVCDPSKNDTGKRDANGKITLTPSGGTGSSVTYSFALKTIGGTAIPATSTTIGSLITPAPTPAAGYASVTYNSKGTVTIIEGLPEGNYKATITDDASGCTLEKNFDIALTTTNPSIDPATDITKTANSKCVSTAGFTGTATVDFANIQGGNPAADYSFFWAKASAPTLAVDTDNVLDTNATSNPPVGVEDGDYVLTITDRITGCVSNPIPVTIDSQKPTLTVAESGEEPNSVCDPSKNDTGQKDANGKITLTPSGGTGSSVTYSFALKTIGGTAIPATSTTIGSLITPAPTPAAGYASVTYNSKGTVTIIEGLPEGNYKATITDDASGCTLEKNFDIALTTTNPSIDPATKITKTANSNCAGAEFTGTATVELKNIQGRKDALLPDYGFSWAKASAPTLAIDTDNVLGTNATLTPPVGVENGDYVLTITDRITGCVSNPISVTIDENKPIIDPTITVLKDNFSCDATKPNGSVKVDINLKTPPPTTGSVNDNANYDIKWYKGTTAAGPNIGTTEQIDNLADGVYTVEVTHKSSKCTMTAQATIKKFKPTISIKTTSSTAFSMCGDNVDGVAEVTDVSVTFTPAGPPNGYTAPATGTAGVAKYTYQWYYGTSAKAGKELKQDTPLDPDNGSKPQGNSASGALITSSSVKGLATGDYTVVVTEPQTGCISAIETIHIEDQVSPRKPVVTFTKEVFPSSCADQNGKIKAEITGLGSGVSQIGPDKPGNSFSFEWYEGRQDFAMLDRKGGKGLKSGNKQNENGPTITINSTSGGVNSITTLENIFSGLYTLVTTDKVTGCRFSHFIDLGFAGQQITTTITIDHVTECPDNGIARVGLADNIILKVKDMTTITKGPNGEEKFIIEEGFTALGGSIFGRISNPSLPEIHVVRGKGSASFPSEPNGTILTPIEIKGTTSGVTAMIDNVRNIGYANATLDEHFDDINQYLVFLYSGTGVPANRTAPYTYRGRRFPYTYNPKTGERKDGDGNPLASGNGPVLAPGEEAEFPDLPAGKYIAIAQEITKPAFNPGSTSQCWTAASVNEQILDLAYEPIITSKSDGTSTNCDINNGNGQLSISVKEDPAESDNGASAQANGFRFTWTNASNVTVFTQDILRETATSTTNADLEPGTYTVEVERLGGAASTSNKCKVSATLTVAYTPEQHNITSATIVNQDDCDPKNGSVTITDAQITDNVADYTFTWYTTYLGEGNTGNVLLEDKFVAGGKTNGASDAGSISGLMGGTYFVEAVHATKTCKVPVFKAEVKDLATIPTFTVVASAQDISCDNATPTGEATVTITNIGTNLLTNYTISWFEDAAATQPLNNTGRVSTATFTADDVNNTIVASNLPEGDYFVSVRDIDSPSKACQSGLQKVTVQSFKTLISVGATAGTDFKITHTDDCDPLNGAFEILNVIETRPNGETTETLATGNDYVIGDYTFTWLESDKTTLITTAKFPNVMFPNGTGANGTAGSNKISVLPAGTYYVKIKNTADTKGTGCEQSDDEMVEFIIKDKRVNPIFTVVASAQDISCDNATPTGQATVTITNIGTNQLTDYTIRWFEDATTIQPLNNTGRVKTATFPSSNIASNLPDGDYFVSVRDNNNPGIGCESGLQKVTVQSFKTLISVGATAGTDFKITHTNDCDPVNGAFEILNVIETRPNGGTTETLATGNDYVIGDYTFTWLESDKTTLITTAKFPNVMFPNGTGTGANGTAGSNKISGLPAGTYYVKIKNTADTKGTGCEQSNDEMVEFIIKDERVNPTFTVVASAQDISCDNATPTGQATVTITNIGTNKLTDYTISWFEDAAATQPLNNTGRVKTATFNADNNTASNLPDGDYFVSVRDIDSPSKACQSGLQKVTVQSFKTLISVGATAGTDFKITHANDCDPVNGAFEILNVIETRPNGTSTKTLAPGNDYVIEDYTFTWLESDKTTLITAATFPNVMFSNANGTGANGTAGFNKISGLPAGTYYVKIKNTADTKGTGCEQSDDEMVEFIIKDEKVNPTFTVVASAQDISCDNATPTGVAEVTILNGTTTLADYTISWFEDAAATQPLNNTGRVKTATFPSSNIASNLPDGDYFVSVRDNNNPGTGCESGLQKVTVQSFKTLISVGATAGTDFKITHANDCDPVNGAFEILNVIETRPNGETTETLATGNDYGIGDYTFTWLESDKTTLITTAKFPNVMFPNGTGTGANGTAGSNKIRVLPAGTYYVKIKNTADTKGTGCEQSNDEMVEFIIKDEKVNPTFTVVASAQDISCDNATPTGVAEVTILNGTTTPANLAEYTISWFEDAAATQPLNNTGRVSTATFNANNNIASTLPDGDYFVSVRDKNNPGIGCESGLQKVTVQSFKTLISVGATAGTDFKITHANDCDPVNGAFEILNVIETRPNGGTTGNDYGIEDYTFTWLESDKTTLITAATFPNVMFPNGNKANGTAGSNKISGLPTGTYYVKIKNTADTKGTECEQSDDEMVEFIIKDEKVNPTFTVVASAQDISCDNATPTGQATVTITNKGTNKLTDYTISWFEDAAATQPLNNTGRVSTATFNADDDNNTIVASNLPDGDYFVSVRDNNNPGTGCESGLQKVTVQSFKTLISVGATAGTDFKITHTNDCDPVNGAFEILNVIETRPNGGTTGNDYGIGDYTFTWLESDKTTLITAATFPNVMFSNANGTGANGTAEFNKISGLPAGTYYVKIKNTADTKGTGCEQSDDEMVEFIIKDERVNPTFTIVASAQDISCNNATPTGVAEVTILNGTTTPANLAGYTISWFEDAAATQPLNNTGRVKTATFNADNNTASTLPDGDYFVRVRDNNNPGIGCESGLQKVTVQSFKTLISVGATAGTDFKISHTDDCDPVNGAFEILNVIETRPNGETTGNDYAIGDYTFTWLGSDKITLITTAKFPNVMFSNANGTGANGAAGFNKISGLPAGTYYVKIKNTAAANGTGCEQSDDEMIEFIIKDERVNPTFTVVATAKDISCDDNATPTGVAEVNIFNGTANPDNPAKYIISWFEDADATQPLNNVKVTFTANNSIASNLPDGDYFVRVRGKDINTGCESRLQKVTVQSFNPFISVGTTANTDFVLTHSDNCDPVSGAFEILNVTETRPNGTSTKTLAPGNDYVIGDYTFTWLGSDKTTLITAATFPNGANGTAGSNKISGLPAGTYYVKIKNTANVNGTKCEQSDDDIQEFIINDVSSAPQVDISAASNTICDDNIPPTGAITVVIKVDGQDQPTKDYTYEWFKIDEANNSQSIALAAAGLRHPFTFTPGKDNSEVIGLPEGEYKVKVTDNTKPGTGCFTEKSVTIENQPATPVFNIPNAQLTHSERCAGGNGSFTLSNNNMNPVAPLTDFTWELQGPAGNSILLDLSAGTGLFNSATGIYNHPDNLEVGDYSLVATKRTTGCASVSGITFSILDHHTIPQLTIALVNDRGCSTGTLGIGEISLTLGDQDANRDNANDTFSIEWFSGTSATGTVLGTGTSLNNLRTNDYTVKVTNNESQCSVTQVINLPSSVLPVLITGRTTEDQTTCTSNGSISVNLISFNGTDHQPDFADFDFTWQTDNGLAVAGAQGDEKYERSKLAAGSYTVVANHSLTGCNQTMLFDVENSIVMPVADITLIQVDQSCIEAGANGELGLLIDGSTNINDYTITWFKGDETTGTAIANNVTSVDGLVAGTYTVEALNNVTGCRVTSKIVLENNPLKPLLTIPDLTITPMTICSPANGKIEINNIVPGAPADYSYEMFNYAGFTKTSAPLAIASGNVFSGVSAGTYLIRATHKRFQCASIEVEVIVEDKAKHPVIEQLEFEPQTNCNPAIPNGAMTLAANGSTDLNAFSFTWFKGTEATGTPFEVNNNVITNLPAGNYTVLVTDRSTGCTSSEIFPMIDASVNPLEALTTSTPNDKCVAPFHGVVAANLTTSVDGRQVSDYKFVWNEGTSAPTFDVFDHEGQSWEDINGGEYTLMIFDMKDPVCTSNPIHVVVEDATILPDVIVTETQPLTICYKDQPNGELSAVLANNTVTGHTFEWFKGNIADPVAKIFDGPVIGHITAGPYTLLVTNAITGCKTEEIVEVTDQTIPPANPTLTLVGNMTNCETPNGEARATVDGEIGNYKFEWYEATDLTTPIYTGFDPKDLGRQNETVKYLVKATNLITGCVSEESEIAISDARTTPVFTVDVKDSECTNPTGSAILRFPEPIELDSIVWNSGADFISVGSLFNAPRGLYSVTIWDANRCTTTKEFEIRADLAIYNGVSNNDDGLNDFFLVDCIDLFPNNNIKIYNRAGALVYETDNYDNSERLFNGHRNRGIALGSTELPTGTYFYLIDKRDGSDIISGYLELVR